MVPAPSFFTLASQEVRILSSRSVAVMVRRLPLASTKRFERMGMVVLRSTTPCVSSSSSSRSDLVELEIGGRDGEAAAFGFDQKIREDGNGGLALDDALRQFEFVEQVRSFYAEFHLRQPSQYSS